MGNSRSKVYPIRLLPSMNGWLIKMLSVNEAAFSKTEGYNSLPSNVWKGLAIADSNAELSLMLRTCQLEFDVVVQLL